VVLVQMLSRNNRLCGFRMEGHAGGKAGSDIVCAAISSAVYMAANTVTEVCGCEADITVEDGFFFLMLKAGGEDRAADVLEGLRLHLTGLQEQYPRRLHVDLITV